MIMIALNHQTSNPLRIIEYAAAEKMYHIGVGKSKILFLTIPLERRNQTITVVLVVYPREVMQHDQYEKAHVKRISFYSSRTERSLPSKNVEIRSLRP